MQARKACLKVLKESKVANQYPEPSQQTQVSLLLLMPLPQWKAAVMQPMLLPQELVMQPMLLPQELVMQPMLLPQELVMQPMLLPQAMAEQPPAIKLAAAHLPYMVVVEAANRELQHLSTLSQKQVSFTTSVYYIQTWSEQPA